MQGYGKGCRKAAEKTTHALTQAAQPAVIMAGWASGTGEGRSAYPVPPAGEKRCESISGVWGESPSGCRAEPCRPPRRRRVQGQSPAARRAGKGIEVRRRDAP